MIYAMGDIHGCQSEFQQALELVDLTGNNKLVLLGDYIHGGSESYEVLDKVMELQQKYGCDRVIALMGNHEESVINGITPLDQEHRFDGDYDNDGKDDRYISWMTDLPRFYTEGNTIFVHAGIDESLGEDWEYGDDYIFTEKFPPQIGNFEPGMNIVAGHISTAEISGDPRFHGIFYDGESHYYIDGSVLDSGEIPVIAVDPQEDQYYEVTEWGNRQILPSESQ